MEPFEYLSVLISIVLGLGITHLLLGFGRWLEQRSRFGAYGPVMAWAAFLLLLHVQTWWTMFGYRVFMDWDFVQFSIVLLQPIVLFLLAVVVFPGPDAPHRDLRDNFLHQRPWFFGLLALLLLVSVVKDLARNGRWPTPLNLTFHGVFLLIALAGGLLRRERGQGIVACAALTTLITYIAILFADL